MLDVAALDAWYGKAQILYGVSLRVDEGECVALMGRNGAGKSTTLKTIMGLLARRRGRVSWRGRDISALAPYRIARLGLGWVPEDRRIFTDLTVRENLSVGRQPRRAGAPFWTEAQLHALFPKLGELRDRMGGVLSGGEQQMLTIARTLMGNPELLLLDEPSEGLAPVIVENLLAQVQRLKGEGLTILLAEQGVDFSLSLADRVYVLEKGAVRFSGAAAQLRDDADLRHKLLAL